MLLLGGGLALYLGFDELKDTWKKETSRSKTGSRQGNLTGPRFSSVHWFFGQSHGAAKPPDF
jgi:hypothetical protein